ncbi:MAG: hypothetical protein ACRC8W_04255 [Plesiomonas shigelloides]
MTPCEEKGYKLGDMFLMAADDEILELIEDDGDDVPLFRNHRSSHDRYVHIDFVQPLNIVATHIAPIDTRIAQLEQELNTLHEQRREIINRNNLNK